MADWEQVPNGGLSVLLDEQMTTDLVPDEDGTRSIGSESRRVKKLWASELDFSGDITGNVASVLNVKAFGVKGDGITDDTQALQTMLDNLTDGAKIHFPAGNYILSDSVKITKSNVQLEFSKDAKVTYNGTSATEHAFFFAGDQNVDDAVSVTADINSGDTEISVASIPVGLAPGDWIYISTDEVHLGADSARPDYTMSEFHVVESIDTVNLKITVRQPFVLSYQSSGFTLTVSVPTFLENVGVKGLNIFGNDPDSRQRALGFEFCRGVIVSDCHIDNFRRDGIVFRNCVMVSCSGNFVRIPFDSETTHIGIFASRSQFVVISSNTVESYVTGIDLTTMTMFSVVANNVSRGGDVSTHDALVVSLEGNIIHGSFMQIRGSLSRCVGNTIFGTSSTVQPMIKVTENARHDINIEHNTIYLPNDNTITAIECSIDGFERLKIANNDIYNPQMGIDVSLPNDSETMRKTVISNNMIQLNASGNRGILASRHQDIIISGNSISRTTGGTTGGTGVLLAASATDGSFKNAIIKGNMVLGNFSTGISCTSGYSSVSVTSNIVDGATTAYNINATSSVNQNNLPAST